MAAIIGRGVRLGAARVAIPALRLDGISARAVAGLAREADFFEWSGFHVGGISLHLSPQPNPRHAGHDSQGEQEGTGSVDEEGGEEGFHGFRPQCTGRGCKTSQLRHQQGCQTGAQYRAQPRDSRSDDKQRSQDVRP